MTTPLDQALGIVPSCYREVRTDVLPSRLRRLASATADAAMTFVAGFPLLAFYLGAMLDLYHYSNVYPSEVDAALLVVGTLGSMGLAGAQITLLTVQGQTIGKLLFSLRIVRVESGGAAGFGAAVLMRGFVPALLSAVPFAGSLFALANPLYVFTPTRRCLHDRIASTVVVYADATAGEAVRAYEQAAGVA